MAKRHKTVEQARAHLEQSIAIIPARYKEGVSGADWQGPAGSEQSEANFGTAMSQAIAAKSRQAGVLAVTNAEWQRRAAEKGAPVIGERIRAALGVYAQRFGPVLNAMNSAADAAPPRTTDFLSNIQNRLVPVVAAAKLAAGRS